MRWIYVLLMLLFSCFALADEPAPGDGTTKPNIIVVMSDDHGQWASKKTGIPFMQTPNLDFIARQGVSFVNAMTPAPVCSPSRASFHTGKMPSQHGVHDFLSEDKEFDANWLQGETFLAEHLQQEDYKTALIGKWHATSDSTKPQRGFDYWLSYDARRVGWRNQYVHSGEVGFSENGDALDHIGVQARFLTQKAIEFIEGHKQHPFFISLNYVEPHAPFEGLPERLVQQYRHKVQEQLPSGDKSEFPHLNQYTLVPKDHHEQLAQYLAAISLLDEQIGTLLDALQGRGLLDDSIVFFVADHGMLVGQYGLYGKTNATSPSNFYEEVIRIPFFVLGGDKWIKPAQRRQEFVDLLDLHTTIRDFSSAEEIKEVSYGPGKSIRSLLAGDRAINWRQYQFAERGNGRMVTNGHWKLVRYYGLQPNLPFEDKWYDLSHPLGERFASPPPREAMQERLIQQLEGFFSKYETPKYSGTQLWRQPYPNHKTRDMFKALGSS